jgi:hypothetical protein
MTFSAIRPVVITAGCMLVPLWCAVTNSSQDQAKFVMFKVGIVPTPYAINASQTVTGWYDATGGADLHGFVRLSSGTIISFDPPGSTQTEPRGINAEGIVTGWYVDAKLVIHGFLRSPSGTITSFDVAGSSETFPSSINAAGAIAGYYSGGHGFVRSPQGTITSFDFPGSIATQAYGINAAGAIAGSYLENSVWHGFVRSAHGTFTSFDPPGSLDTEALSINAEGSVAGTYTSYGAEPSMYRNRVVHGFVRSAAGTITSFDPPGSTTTQVRSINAAGTITGFYFVGFETYYGFVRSPQGTITTFNAGPGDGNTTAFSINDGGVITGSYFNPGDPSAGTSGFLRTPHGGHDDDEFQPGTYAVTDSGKLYIDGGFYLYGDSTVRLWVYVAGNPSQHWTFTKVAGGFTMLNQGTGQYASDIGGKLVEGGAADVWTVSPGIGGFTLKNNRTGLFLTDPGVQNGALTLTSNGSVWQMSPPR